MANNLNTSLQKVDPKIDFYQTHLNKVSRSFAYGISILENPLRSYVSLAYLICRVIDTLEDSVWNSKEQQALAFQNLKKSLLDSSFKFDLSFLNEISAKEAELDLLKDSHELIKDYHHLPLLVQKHIKKLAISMIDGMQLFSPDVKKTASTIKIKTLHELNIYCFFVAGIVGECLSHLVDHMNENNPKLSKNLKNSYYFGLFLQKVNILKDQKVDELEGRFFVPDRHKVLGSTISHIKNVVEYILDIPGSQSTYKTFCMVAFFLGLKVLSRIDPQSVEVEPIPRTEAQELLLEMAELQNSEKFKSKVESFFKKIPPTLEKYRNSEDPIDLGPYRAILSKYNI